MIAAYQAQCQRRVDAALENLGLVDAVTSPVILSKLGYGAETNDRSIDALTYAAFQHPPTFGHLSL